MVLSIPQIQELLKSPANAAAIQQAINHEDRVKLHTKSVDTKEKASAYFNQFLRWVEEGIMLPPDKMAAFKGMCQFPLATTALCNSIFDEYEKIFTAQDHFFDVEIADETLKADYLTYLDELKLHKYFETKGFEEFKKQPASVYVVDLPTEQLSDRPAPYFTKISIRRIHDIGVQRMFDGTDRIGYIIFKSGTDQYMCFDDMSYRMFTQQQDGQFILAIDSPHNLGYTPATFLPKLPLYDDDDASPVARKVAISDSLGDLDWLLAYKVFERMYETFGPFPIMTVPETQCNYTDGLGNMCKSGFVSGTRLDGTIYEKECPSCKKNSIVGPGTVFGRPVPRAKEDPQLTKAVEFTPADVASLDYITNKIDYLEWMIYENNVGDSGQMLTKEAVNAKQVQSSVEGKRNVLFKIKKDFELTEKFLVDTIGRLRYADYYVGSTVNYGEQFLLHSPEELTQQYADAKKSGLPVYLISQKKDQLIQTEYRNNPTIKQRANLLDQLEPWSNLSLAECITYQLNNLFPDKFFLKLDFAKFISKFESANGDIVQWGSALSIDKKIEKLSQILLDYGNKESSSAKQLPQKTPIAG
jgi:hypothetical protein